MNIGNFDFLHFTLNLKAMARSVRWGFEWRRTLWLRFWCQTLTDRHWQATVECERAEEEEDVEHWGNTSCTLTDANRLLMTDRQTCHTGSHNVSVSMYFFHIYWFILLFMQHIIQNGLSLVFILNNSIVIILVNISLELLSSEILCINFDMKNCIYS